MPPTTQDYFEIRTSRIQGRGAFALRRIRKGTRLIEYTGERISNAEADRRYDDATMKRHHTFLFTLTSRTVIDAAHGGNEARFINHSCDPNCEAVIEDGHIYIEAIRTIQPGEELVYDYKYERGTGPDALDEAHYPCYCGSPKCRGTILAPPTRRPKKSAKKTNGRAKRTKRAVRS
jgi:SET domain-containing protein